MHQPPHGCGNEAGGKEGIDGPGPRLEKGDSDRRVARVSATGVADRKGEAAPERDGRGSNGEGYGGEEKLGVQAESNERRQRPQQRRQQSRSGTPIGQVKEEGEEDRGGDGGGKQGEERDGRGLNGSNAGESGMKLKAAKVKGTAGLLDGIARWEREEQRSGERKRSATMVAKLSKEDRGEVWLGSVEKERGGRRELGIGACLRWGPPTVGGLGQKRKRR